MDENGVPNFRKIKGVLVVTPSHLVQDTDLRYLKLLLPLQFFKVHLTSRASKLSLILGGRIVNHFNEPAMVMEPSTS
jgi:hypothetical protein